MQFNIQRNFDRATLIRLLATAVRQWSGLCEIDALTINCSSEGCVSAYAMMRFAGRKGLINFHQDVIVAGICQSLAAEGNAIDRASLTFKYSEGHGYGGSSSVTATANPAAADAPNQDAIMPAAATKTGSISFPGTVTVHFGIDEVTDLLKDAVKREGGEPSHAWVSYTDAKTCAANISVKIHGGASGTITLTAAETNDTLSEELTSRGYTVAPDGFLYSYSEGGHGSRGGTSMTVSFTAIPK